MGQRDWDERYLQLAAHISTWSKDKAKVGAVLVRDNRIIGVGFNGFPTGVQDDFERLTDKPTKQAMVVHAEENALLSAGARARGASLYVYGKPVCARCAASIIQAKISVVIGVIPSALGESKKTAAKSDAANGEVDWDAMGRIALNMFKEARVQWHEGTLQDFQCEFMKQLPGKLNIERRNGNDRRAALRIAAE